jgi:hypothetical protein
MDLSDGRNENTTKILEQLTVQLRKGGQRRMII